MSVDGISLIQLVHGEKSFGKKTLFSDAIFSINEGEHVGVIGPNGAGKTTLFKILTDQEDLDRGTLVKARHLRLGYLAQHDDWDEKTTVADYVEKDAIVESWGLRQLGRDLGLEDRVFSQPISSLSGGYRMRCKLLHLLGQQPNLMLLDEPTNYLDLETMLILEKFLQDYQGAFLLISHDREFLKRTTDHVLEVESAEITKYPGNIEDYFEQKELLRSQLEAQASSVQAKRQQILDFVARFGAKATKARQAQSRLKMLGKLETIELKPLVISASIKIPTPRKAGRHVVKLKAAKLGYGDRTVLSDINLHIEAGQHVAVVGVNGAGKSTLLKTLVGRIPLLGGDIEVGHEISFGYYAQHVSEALDPDDTVFDSLQKAAGPLILPQEILTMAGSLLFSGDDVKKKSFNLSGGEKARVALGQILLQRHPCLVLDEPTNHLDFHTVEALTLALEKYSGAVIIVSHDRSFVRRVGKQILEIRNHGAYLYPGTYDDYVWSVQRKNAEPTEESNHNQPSKKVEKESKTSSISYRENKKAMERTLRQNEKRVGDLDKLMKTCQQKIEELNEMLSGGKFVRPLSDIIKELQEAQKILETSESEWLKLSEESERIKAELEECS